MESLAKMLHKRLNKYSINTFIKSYERMILGDHFNLEFVCENSILSVLKTIQVSKAAGLDSLSGHILKYSKHISDFCSFLMGSKNIPENP